MVKVTKAGLARMEWEPRIREYVEAPCYTFLAELRSKCIVEDGVTLGDIFRAVEKDPGLRDFLAIYSSCPVEAFHKEAMLPPQKPTDLTKISIAAYLEVSPATSVHIDVSGVGQPGDAASYALDFTPVNEIVELPVVLEPEIEIFTFDAGGRTVLAKCEYDFSVLEVLGEIYFEISFHGSPEQRDERFLEVNSAMDKIRAGKASLVPHFGLGKPN